MQSLTEILYGVGLTKNQSAVYLALLSSGTAPASSISKRVGLPKSTTQYTCQQLAKRGLISVTQQRNTFLFTAEPPSKLHTLLQRQHQDLTKKEQELRKVMDTLESLTVAQANIPRVQYYEGSDGIAELYEKILQLRSPIDSIREKGDLCLLLPQFAPQFERRRIESGIRHRCIAPEGSAACRSSPGDLLEIRHVNPEKYPLSCDITMCGDRVFFFSYDPGAAIGITIFHQDLTRNFRLFFEYLWNTLDTADQPAPQPTAMEQAIAEAFRLK